ncbi:hypothetical protein C0J52_19092, partial [Blattella germanica]
KTRGFGIKITNKNGHSIVLEKDSETESLPAATRLLWNHFEQLASGEVQVYYEDGSVLTVNSATGAVQFQKHGRIKRYSQNDGLPEDLKLKLMQIPRVVSCLMKVDTDVTSSDWIPRTRTVR